MTYFALEDVHLRFGGLSAIRDLSFEVKRGEIFAIIGPNGAGKTSVFNVITRVYAPAKGRVVFKGQDITAGPRHDLARIGIGRTFQNIELFEHATVLDNLLLGRHRFESANILARLLRTPAVLREEADSREKIERIIDFLELSSYRNVLVKGLPYGIRKVIELGRALATEPELLLLDEPASGLNPEETRDLGFWIEDINRDLGITVIMIEHDMSIVADIASRVLCMNQGQPLATGSLAEVRATPAVVAAYLGT